MAIKLVLEGGGARAAYSAGLVHALLRAGVRPRAVVGCSSGSINAAFVASGQTETLCDLWSNYVAGKHFISWRRQFTPFAPPGLAIDDMLDRVMIGQGLFDPVAATRGDPALYVAVTDVLSGAGVLVQPTRENVVEWLRASLALPVGYNRIVRIGGRGFIDGGVAMPVPFDEPIATECPGPTVVVLTRKMDTLKRAPSWWQKMFIWTSVPRAARAATLRQHELHNAVMNRLRNAVQQNAVLLVNPPAEMPLQRFTRDRARLSAGIELGMEVGARLAQELTRSGAGSSSRRVDRKSAESGSVEIGRVSDAGTALPAEWIRQAGSLASKRASRAD
jgi:predicted patatin/cPLA2 family phospholipase